MKQYLKFHPFISTQKPLSHKFKDVPLRKQKNIPTRGSSLLGSFIKSFRQVMSFVSPLFTEVKNTHT